MAVGPDVMTVVEAKRTCEGQWLSLKIVSREENGAPLTVSLIACAPTMEALCERVRTSEEVYITFGGPPVPAGRVFLYVAAT